MHSRPQFLTLISTLCFIASFIGCGEAPVAIHLDGDPQSETSTDNASASDHASTTEADDSTGDTMPSDESEDTTTPNSQAPTGSDCSLVLRAEVQDESGPCSTCRAGDSITLVGIIENPCETSLTYESQKDCLVSAFVAYNTDTSSSSEYAVTCQDAPYEEHIAPNSVVTRTRPAGRLSAASYELTVQFEDVELTARTRVFTVQ